MMYKALRSRDDIDRLYMSRNGGKGVANNEDSIDSLIRRLKVYIKKCTAITNNTNNTRINRTTRKQTWDENELYGHFKQQTNEISHEKTKQGKHQKRN